MNLSAPTEATDDLTDQIQLLPPVLVNRIAAGEVVERPASVIKELAENAIDAGATRVDIQATNGGRNLRLADNGRGMTAQNARLAFLNHATSKLHQPEDLYRVQTLGFRGEALASIASVSRLTCLTRSVRETDPAFASGVQVTVGLDGLPTLAPAGCAPGTVMQIEDLFYTTPARLAFLKKPQTELSHIQETVEALALAHPEIQWSLTVNDRQTLKTHGTGQLRDTLKAIAGSRLPLADLMPVHLEDLPVSLSDEEGEAPLAGLSLSGLISPPSVQQASRRWVYTLVNGRVVRCGVIAKAIESAYESLLPHGKHPVAVVVVTVPPEAVDVNVHPTKREVRYRQPNVVFALVRDGLRQALAAHRHTGLLAPKPMFPPTEAGYSPDIASGSSIWTQAAPRSGPPRPPERPSSWMSLPQSQAALDLQRPLAHVPTDEASAPESPAPSALAAATQAPAVRVIGQLMNTFILVESPQGLMVVDQHIASERTFFEALSRQLMDPVHAGEAPIQQLIGALPQPVSAAQASRLDAHTDGLHRLGFRWVLDADDAQGPQVTLTGVPLIFADRQPKDLWGQVLASLEENDTPSLDLDHLIATLACHSAVRAGDILSEGDMRAVMDRWLACELPWTCPHGRPVAHTIRTEELQLFFHRPSMPRR